ncbi:MAG: ATP-binding protein [Bacteroidales bacterium]|nr:ATP-binding protein [Bacteroidales bacterium]
MAHQKSLSDAVIDMQENERARIAADLHDDLVGKLRAVHLMLTTGKTVKDKNAPDVLAQSIELTRQISHDLMPPMLKHSSFFDLTEEAAFLLHKKHHLNISESGCEIGDVFDNHIKLQFFRIIKEVINNIDKHAEAKTVTILLRCNAQYIAISINDDGKGLPEDFSQNGLGIKNIEIRAQRLSAAYKFMNRGTKGSRFVLCVPLNQ